MSKEYSVDVCRQLEAGFHAAKLHRPMRISRYDAGTELTYDVQGVSRDETAKVHLLVEKFIGGGFAGQVYRVKVTGIEGAIKGLEAGKVYAIKILIPPSGFSRFFRNFLYWIGFQGPFQLQVNPAAARAGALWQKLIRRGAKIRFGDENAVVDIYGTFVDNKQGSCGELREWVEGRTWRLEVDDRMDLLKNMLRGKKVDEQQVGSPEYRAKRKFMKEFVGLLHDIGAYEFARQYEWSTCKSQPNALKRKGTDNDPSGGLVAVDFRAGLTLLPFLPMSPGDFKLIGKGLMRGSLVQFDRGDLKKLDAFVQAHPEEFADMHETLEELKTAEQLYRDAIPDVTHNHVRLLYDRKLWSTMLNGAVTGWQVRNISDRSQTERLRRSRILIPLFALPGLFHGIGLLVTIVSVLVGIGVGLAALAVLFGYRPQWLVPLAISASSAFVGGIVLSNTSQSIRKLWGRSDYRRHYRAILSSWDYFKRAVRGRIAEKVIDWHRDGRIDERKASRITAEIWPFFRHLPLSILPAGLHKFLTDFKHAKERLAYYLIRPVRLYFNAQMREQWLREMMSEGQKKHMLSDEDSQVILSQLSEPFIQKYLKSLAVHVCTLPVTQVVSVTLAVIYVLMHPEMPRTESWGIGLGIIALFQVTPISPGSLTRGLYVLYLVIRERNFKDYNIAVFLGFFKYVGYLAFPIQMTYHYPVLARFMSAHWATDAAHVVPIFGERGALLEHWVFCLFYNWPLTIRRRMRIRAEARALKKPRYWHAGLCAAATAGIFVLADYIYLRSTGEIPGLRDIWWLTIFVPLTCGAVVTLSCRGAALGKRIVTASISGVLTAAIYAGASVLLNHGGGILASGLWRMFIFALLATIGAIATEIKLPESYKV